MGFSLESGNHTWKSTMTWSKSLEHFQNHLNMSNNHENQFNINSKSLEHFKITSIDIETIMKIINHIKLNMNAYEITHILNNVHT